MNLLIANGKLIDGRGNITENAWIFVRDKKIEKLGKGDIPKDLGSHILFDVTGKTVLPGLIDCHVHMIMNGEDPQTERKLKSKNMMLLQAVASCRKTLISGITTVRDMGSFAYEDILLRDAIEREFITGPRIICSGRPICATGGHGWTVGAREADGVEEVRKAVREQIKAGADNIKIMASGGFVTKGVEPIRAQFSPAELDVAVEEARKAGKTIAAHSHPAESIRDCVRSGMDSIDHVIFADDEAIDMMAERGVYMSPTLAPPKRVFENPNLAPEWLWQKVEGVIPIHYRSATKAYRAGVKIVMGSDAGSPPVHHGENLGELRELVSIGMTAHEAILSATSRAAELLRLEEVTGSIQEGKIADIIIVEGDPLHDVTILEDKKNIPVVIKAGEIVKDCRFVPKDT